MKKIFALLLVCTSLAIGSNAQVKRETQSPRTMINADTLSVNFNAILSHVKSFQITCIKNAGTVAGKVYLKGTVDGIAWFVVDSLVLTDQPTNSKLFPVNGTVYNSYQAYFLTTGTVTLTPYFSVLRRQDE